MDLEEKARDALGRMEQAGLEHSDFSYGDLPNFWKKLLPPSIEKPPTIGSRLKEQLEGTKTLYRKAEEGTEKGKTIQAVGEQLGPECLAVQDDFIYWKKLRHIRGQFHSIALLGEVLGSLQDIKDERNLVLMHELGSLIAKELREQPSAYLFERLGERYEQLFIDEFQDTSLEQWNNLQSPLWKRSLLPVGRCSWWVMPSRPFTDGAEVISASSSTSIKKARSRNPVSR